MPPVFRRRPDPGQGIVELGLEVSGTTLSGLLALPSGPDHPRGLIVAVHGANMHAGYFDARSAPGLSLLEIGSRLGYAVWAPDRPGIGASADLEDDRLRLFPQAELLMDAIDEYRRTRPTGAGVVLVGHSYGLKVAWAMAASGRGRDLLGVDGSGAGVRYAFDWGTVPGGHARRPDDMQRRTWGPRSLYPQGTISRRTLPMHPMPGAQASEGGRWPEEVRRLAPRITVPIRVTFAEHEGLWPVDSPSLEEVRSAFPNAPRVHVEIEPNAGHNISLGWAAHSYHLKVLAFAESVRLRHLMRSWTRGPEPAPTVRS